MTRTSDVKERTGRADEQGPLANLRELASRNASGERLLLEVERHLQARARHALTWAGHRMGAATQRLAGGGDRSVSTDDTGDGKGGRGPLGAVRSGLSTLGGRLRTATRRVLDRRARKKGGGRSVTIVEDLDVGLPVRDVYDQWTLFQDFDRFAEGVREVDQVDDTTTDWSARILFSRRTWRAEILEQVPDERIRWTSDGTKGTTRGTVTFHDVTPDLTRVLLVLDHRPRGLLERLGNAFGAQRRRVRRDLAHFRRFVSLREERPDGWRGEVRDGAVVDRDEEDRPDDGATPSDADRSSEPDDATAGRRDEFDADEDDHRGEARAEDDAEDGPEFEDDADEDDLGPEDEVDDADDADEDEDDADEDEAAGRHRTSARR
ncbi:SRPBCC family protein [Actinoalloteichus caeruleus]|uniref:SRPBCC family protein n=1 Tax=Actinoalloteichus cyanogriseus TaxID=2893586 RepID=UPI003AB0D959